MFSRTSSHALQAAKAELNKTGVRYTAQSKKNRIEVQLLKDFPGVGVRGQVVSVKPSAMTNRLYPNNGAVYLNYKGAEPVIPVVSKQAALTAAAALKSAQKQKEKQNKVKLNPILKNEIEQSKKKGETLLSLDDLLAFDVNDLTKDQLELVFAKLPKKIVFVKKSTDKVLQSPLEKTFIINQIESTLSRYLKEKDIVSKFFNSSATTFTIKGDSDEELASISKLGAYYVNVEHQEQSQLISVIVNEK